MITKSSWIASGSSRVFTTISRLLDESNASSTLAPAGAVKGRQRMAKIAQHHAIQSWSDSKSDGTVELATFYVGGALCGMDILKVQEINKLMEMTKVPQAPSYVMGILNLRGQIVTIIDLGKKLGLTEIEINESSRNIIVNSDNEYIGLLVSRISDVVEADWQKVEAPPANIGGVQGIFFKGVFKMEDRLIGILDADRVLAEDN
jgi:purine-binding chemotaxis protein CheW